MEPRKRFQVHVSSALVGGEHLVDSEWSLATFREKLERITGVPAATQIWTVSNSTGAPVQVAESANDDWPLHRALGLNSDHWRLSVGDSRPPSDQLDLTDRGEKYEMSHQQYEQRENSVLNWKKREHLGRFAESGTSGGPDTSSKVDLAMGQRGLVQLASGDLVPGTVAYVGPVAEIPGDKLWVGVALDHPKGRNDGILGTTRYFDARPDHGVFIQPAKFEPLSENPEQTSAEADDDEI